MTPSTLKTVLHELIAISKVNEDVKCMTEAMVDRAGTVVQRLKYEAENLLSEYCQMIDSEVKEVML